MHPYDRNLRLSCQGRSDMTTLGSWSLKVRKNGGAATTYTSATSPAIAAFSDDSSSVMIDLPASTYAADDKLEWVWLYASARVAVGALTVGPAADPLSYTVPGSYASGAAGYVLGHVIPGQNPTILQPLATDLELTVVQGDDYNASDSRAIDWTEPNASWPTLTSATVKFGYQELVNGQLTGSVTELSMSIVTGTGSSKKVRLELSAAQSAALGVGARRYQYDVQATLTSGRKVTLARGLVTVLSSFVA